MQNLDGFRGLWSSNQPQNDEFHFKYSGGFATYPQQHIPIAVYDRAAHKTFFCYGGARDAPPGEKRIANMISFFDHQSGEVARPVVVVERHTDDAHYNPTLMIDGDGFLFVFCNAHGQGYEQSQSDPTFGRALIYRSEKPGCIEKWVPVSDDNFSYSQVWPLSDGALWLHTRYQGPSHHLFYASATQNQAQKGEWTAPKLLADIGFGSYQISWTEGNRVATALDYHPLAGQAGLNARTNLYFLETRDGGNTWQNAAGKTLSLPLRELENEALVYPFEREGTLIYLKNIAFDGNGNPVILFISSRSPWSGPQNPPREWNIAHWTGKNWEIRALWSADHNYDHGFLNIENSSIEGEVWRLIAPIEAGPQAGGTGGAMSLHISRDEGRTWQCQPLFNDTDHNQTYARQPLHAHPDFWALWATGHAFEPSDSQILFANIRGEVFQLPTQMSGAFAKPEPIGPRFS